MYSAKGPKVCATSTGCPRSRWRHKNRENPVTRWGGGLCSGVGCEEFEDAEEEEEDKAENDDDEGEEEADVVEGKGRLVESHEMPAFLLLLLLLLLHAVAAVGSATFEWGIVMPKKVVFSGQNTLQHRKIVEKVIRT